MAAFSRGFLHFLPRGETMCMRCSFSTAPATQSGHSRWSKIKHDKGAVDAKKNLVRSQFSREIALCSKMHGGDPSTNFKLATILANAKKAGFPKASMEAAIARGQGKSATGAALEYFTLEVMLPPQMAIIIETETDNKARISTDLRLLVRKAGGNVTPTNYLFQKRGRVVFEKDEKLGVDQVLEEAIEAGAEDVEADEDGSIIVWTEPNKTMEAGEALEKSLGLKVESSDIIWDPNEDTVVPLSEKSDAEKLAAFIETVQDNPGVQGVYANVTQGSLSDDDWDNVAEKLYG